MDSINIMIYNKRKLNKNYKCAKWGCWLFKNGKVPFIITLSHPLRLLPDLLLQQQNTNGASCHSIKERYDLSKDFPTLSIKSKP